MGTNGSFKSQELNIYGMIKKLCFYKQERTQAKQVIPNIEMHAKAT